MAWFDMIRHETKQHGTWVYIDVLLTCLNMLIWRSLEVVAVSIAQLMRWWKSSCLALGFQSTCSEAYLNATRSALRVVMGENLAKLEEIPREIRGNSVEFRAIVRENLREVSGDGGDFEGNRRKSEECHRASKETFRESGGS